MAYDAKAIANYFLELAKGDPAGLSPMKLQKLVYYAHGWHLALTGEPLIDEQVEAWEWGPVVPSLFHEFKDFGSDPIKRPAFTIIRDQSKAGEPYQAITPSIQDDPGNAEFVKHLLDRIWSIYGSQTAARLSNMTHATDSPWSRVFKEHKDKVPRSTDIPVQYIKDYFLGLKRRNETAATG